MGGHLKYVICRGVLRPEERAESLIFLLFDLVSRNGPVAKPESEIPATASPARSVRLSGIVDGTTEEADVSDEGSLLTVAENAPSGEPDPEPGNARMLASALAPRQLISISRWMSSRCEALIESPENWFHKEPSISGDSGIHPAASEKIRPVLLWHRSRDGEPEACCPQAIYLGGITKGSRPNAHAKAAIAGTHLVSEQLQVVSPAPLDDFDSTIVELPIHHGGRPNLGRHPRGAVDVRHYQ